MVRALCAAIAFLTSYLVQPSKLSCTVCTKASPCSFVLQVDAGDALLILMKYDCDIALGHNPKFDITVVRDMKSKLFHDRNADDVSNAVVNPGVNFLAINGIHKLALLEICYGRTSVTVAMQIRIALIDFIDEIFISNLYEGGTTV